MVGKWEHWSEPDNEPPACDAQKGEGIAKVRDGGDSGVTPASAEPPGFVSDVLILNRAPLETTLDGRRFIDEQL